MSETAFGAPGQFQRAVESLPSLLDDLLGAAAKPRKQHGPLPECAAVYLFSDESGPVYVGQTRNLRARLRQHTIPSSTHNSAAFAFNLARRQWRQRGEDDRAQRDKLEVVPEFKELFLRAKQEVSAMNVQFIELADPITRTLFEVYAALELDTREFNLFETH